VAKPDLDKTTSDADVDEVIDVVSEVRARGARQLRGGRLTRLNDRLAGGAARPGEQQITRSPFIMAMIFVIAGLGIVAAVFFFLIKSESEKTRFERADRVLTESKYNEAIQLFDDFLLNYPSGEYSNRARIRLGTAKVRRFTDTSTFTVESAVEAEESLNSFVTSCRDFPEFADEQDRLIGYTEKIARAAASVAADNASEEALEASRRAFARLDSLAVGGGVSVEARERILRMQGEASAAILKAEIRQSSTGEIQGYLSGGDALAALKIYTGLIRRYEVLRDDPEFMEIQRQIRELELSLTATEELGIEALPAEDGEPVRPSLSVNLRTQASSDQISQGKLVFGTGGDVVFAVDSETADPVWKRRIGARSPFAPVQVDGAEPSLLLFHSGRSELLLVRQENGSLIWRQSVEAMVTGQPLVVDQEIYVTTEAGCLWQISASRGAAISRVKFSQAIYGPPALSRDEESLIIPGRQAFVYTLSRRPLACTTVSWTGHEEDTVISPMMPMGKLFLMCENHSTEESRLRALTLQSSGELVERARQTVSGQIWDPCLLRGDQLFVPSTPQRVTAFRISDEPDAEVFSLIDSNQVEDAELGSMFLASGAGGYVWMASSSLRRFQVTTQAVLLDDDVVAKGQHLYPMQVDDQNLMVTTSEPWSSSVFLTRVDRNTMTGKWRFALSTNLVAVGPSAQGNSLIAVSDFGEIFRLPLKPVAETEFFTRSLSQFRLPDGLNDPIAGLAMPDGRMAVWCLGDNAAVWTTTRTGQLEQRWPLPAAPEADPVPLAGGLVVPLPGRLRLVAKQPQAEDYLVSEEFGTDSSWKCLTAISDTRLLAINANDQVVQIEYRETPGPHLAEVSIARLDGATEVAPAAAGDYACIAMVDGRLVLMRSQTLEIVTARDLGEVIGQSPLIAGSRVFVEAGRLNVAVFELNDRLDPLGTFPSPGGQMIDSPLPLSDGGFLAAFSDGVVLRLNPDGLPAGDPVDLDQQLQHGPVRAGESIVVVATDGSLFFLNDMAAAP
jgi:hypothetical protein